MSGKLIAVGAIAGAVAYFWFSPKPPAIAGISGPGVNGVAPIQYTAKLPDGRTVYATQNVSSGYNTNILMVASDGEQRFVPTNVPTSVDIPSYFDASKWSEYEITSNYSLVAYK